MSGLVEVLDAMREAIADGYPAGAGKLDVQVERRFVLQPTPPCIDIYPGDPELDASLLSFGDDLVGAYRITVRTRIATADYDATYDWLLETMDEENDLCLPLVLMTDETLNGLASDIDVPPELVSGLRAYENVHNDGAYLGWQFTALVLAAKS